MEITCDNLSKKYNSEWVFQGANLHFAKGKSYAIVGSNGSGKSTLLQCLSGLLPPTSGTITFKEQEVIHPDYVYKYLTIAAPYLDLLDDYTLLEQVKFHNKFIPFINSFSAEDFITYLQLEKSANKALKYFSSGMRQRVRLGLAMLSERPVLLLDEPTSNLDRKGILWYQEEIEKIKKEKLIMVCSNQDYEYKFCDNTVNMTDLK